MIEYYWAFADSKENAKFHEKLIPFVVQNSIGKLEVEIDGKNKFYSTIC